MLNHLILNTPWLDVRKSILNLYPDQESMIEKFEDVYALLKTLTVQQSGIRIYLEGQSTSLTWGMAFIPMLILIKWNALSMK